MNKIKILQFSDMHFDTPFSGLSKVEREIRREELRETFESIISLVKKSEINIILIPGDLFDNARVSKNTLALIIEKLGEVPAIKVFIAPGNHDPYNEKSYYGMVKWPKNVYIFKGEMEEVIIKDLNLRIYGAAFEKEHIKDSLLSGFKAKKDELINIMVIHGDLLSNVTTSIYNPIFEDDIANSQLDYIALGHQHSVKFGKCGDVFYGYSGIPEGRGFNETGEKGVLIVEASKEGCMGNFINICKRRYLAFEINVDDINGYQGIVDKILNEISFDIRKRDIIRIVLKGSILNDFYLNIEVLKIKIREEFHYVEIIDETVVQSLKNYHENSLKENIIKSLEEKINNSSAEEKEIYNLALKLSLRAICGEEV